MSTSPKIIPFRVLLLLFPRAIALLRRIVALRAAQWVARNDASERSAARRASPPEPVRRPAPEPVSSGPVPSAPPPSAPAPSAPAPSAQVAAV